MRRVLTFLAVAIVLVGVAWWLAGIPGHLSGTLGAYSISLPTPWAIVGLIILFALLYLLARLLTFIVRLPSRNRRLRAVRQRVAGDKAVTRTLLALAGGDGATALRQAQRSRALLGDTPQTLLLAAYAGRQAGQPEEADAAFNELAARKDAAFLGLRGLLQGAIARGDWDAALALANRAEEQSPGLPWVRATRAKIATRNANWREALTLASPGDPVAALGTAAAEAEPDPAAARRLARSAWEADKAFTPAALAYARRLREAGRERRAQDVLRQSWAAAPHPLLAEAALDGATEPSARAARLGALVDAAPAHPESYYLRAQSALDNGNLPQARREAEAAQATGMDSRRLWRLLAAIAEREGDTRSAEAAQRRAADAEPDPQWRCGNCGTVHPRWAPKCDACGTVGQITWGPAGGSQNLLLAADDPILP